MYVCMYVCACFSFATELIENKFYNKSVDAYAFGMLLCEVISGDIPFFRMDISEIRQRVVAGDRPRIPSLGFPRRLVQLIESCW